MTTTFFLVRHAAHDLVDRVLVGRAPGAHLGAEGRAQAERLARRLSRERLSAVQTSPRERAMETAAPIAKRAGVDLQVLAALDEIDCGTWTGCAFDELEAVPSWREWNNARATARAPGGESMGEVQQRIARHLEQAATAHDRRIVIVSHCDVIRAAILHYLGMSLDLFSRIEIAPASVSTLLLDQWGCKLVSLNEQVAA